MRIHCKPLLLAAAAVAVGVGTAARAQPAVDSAADPGAPVGRLTGTVRPLAYRLDLTVLPDQPSFSGVAEIDVDLKAPAAVIYLHGNGLSVSKATATPGTGAVRLARYEQVDPTGVARLTFSEPVPAGRSKLHLEYEGQFGRSEEGLYRSVVAGESYAFTQFEPIDARRMFPGFDEPGFKTPFEISVTTRSANAVIGNAPVLRDEPAGEGLKRVVLTATLPLPTYLVALAVGPFDVVEAPALPPNAVRDRPLPLRGVATRGKGPLFRYALDNTRPILTYLEEYFGVGFPYPKLDLIASPEFGGGMENAGAIVYGDPRILIPDDASFEQRRDFGSVHAHEMAHQWFGDLVTPKWWDDVWLNESFANWMSFKAGNAWRPALRLDIVPALMTPAAMELDSRIAARQIRQPVKRNSDIGSAFDAITYLKGGAVLGMFESYLGEERFRAGIRTHMKRFPYGVADVEDFMSSLAQGSGRPDVVPAFRSFIDQPGVPLVTAKLDCGKQGATLSLAQSRYLPIGSRGDPKRTWQVPLCLRYADEGGLGRQCVLLTHASESVPLQARGCPGFVMPNADGAGYYRFSLDGAGWQALVKNFERLDEREALAAADSLSAAYQADRIGTDEFLAAAATISRSNFAQVAMAPSRDLVRMRDFLAPADQRDAVMALMRELYGPRLAALGPAPDDEASAKRSPAVDAAEVEKALFRTKLLRLLALEAGDLGLRAGLAGDAARYIRLGKKEGGLDESALAPALREIALAAGVQQLGAAFADGLIERMLASDDAQFRSEAAAALAETDDPAVGERVRNLLLDPRLRGREPTTLAFGLAARPSQRRATFDWFKANHEAFIARLSHFGYRWLPRFGAGFCTVPEAEEVQAFFAPMVGQLDGAERTLAETVEGIELCAALADARRDEVRRHFATNAAGTPDAALTPPEADVVAAVKAYHDALTTGDAAAPEEFVLADERFVMIEGQHVNLGWADYRDNHLRGELADLAKVRFRLSEYRVRIDGDRASVMFTFNILPKSGPEMDFGSGRGTAILVRTTDGWKLQQMQTT